MGETRLPCLDLDPDVDGRHDSEIKQQLTRTNDRDCNKTTLRRRLIKQVKLGAAAGYGSGTEEAGFELTGIN
jgi:hypothetical protein